MVTSQELRELSERIVRYSNEGAKPPSCIAACRRAVDALARLGAVLMQSETRQLAANIGNEAQGSLPSNSAEDA